MLLIPEIIVGISLISIILLITIAACLEKTIFLETYFYEFIN